MNYSVGGGGGGVGGANVQPFKDKAENLVSAAVSHSSRPQ